MTRNSTNPGISTWEKCQKIRELTSLQSLRNMSPQLEWAATLNNHHGYVPLAFERTMVRMNRIVVK